MTTFGTPLHEDSNSFKTASTYGDKGDGGDDWFAYVRKADGADEALGATADVAVTNPASAGSAIALLKGLLTILGVGATGVLKAEDAAHASGDSGIMALAVRRDSPTASAGTDGDYSPLSVDSLGRLRVTGVHAEDSAHVSGDLGVSNLGVRNDTRATLGGSDGDYTPFALGAAGALFVHSTPPPATLTGWNMARAATTAAAASLVIKASAGRLTRLWITNGATAQYFQVFNSTTLPADGAVPIHVFRLAANETREINFMDLGDYFSTGIVVSNSSTLATKTIGAADSWISALYL